ncbi:MAG: phosphatase PAP2 family protein [Prevotella sp.]|nr:phosphatase PAP2 family protein [Prevotella sp.]
MKEKNIILAARVMSMLFTPFYLPMVGLIALFIFSYMSLLPWSYKLIVLAMTYLFTILLPTVLIHAYRRYQGWSLIELGAKERRMVPYIISILCYFTCFYLMNLFNILRFIGGILLAALAIQIFCALINVWWKISTHSAAIGGVTGALVAFSFLFAFNPVWWLCFVLLIAGMVGASRIILRQHSLLQVIAGFFVGVLAGFFIIV